MDLIAVLPAFLVAVVLISASPGPAMALIVRRAALHGFRSAIATVAGLQVGLYAWAIAAGAGLTALMAASETAYLVLRVVGAVFLVYLGVRSWIAAFRRPRDEADDGAQAPAERSPRAAFAEGLLVMLANPKAAVFMFAFYPQFVPSGRPLLETTAVLALIQVALEVALYLSLAAGAARAGAWLRRPRVRRRMEAVTGTVLIALGLRVAVAAR